MKADQLYLFKEGKSHIRMAGKVKVRAHRRRNGSYVKEHWRSKPTRGLSMSKRCGTPEEQLIFSVNSETSD